MLSGETAAGMYPIEAVKTMVRIATRTEHDINYLQRFRQRRTMCNPDVTNAISHAVSYTHLGTYRERTAQRRREKSAHAVR